MERGRGPVPRGDGGQLPGGQAQRLGVAEQHGHGVVVGPAGGGGHGQPQPPTRPRCRRGPGRLVAVGIGAAGRAGAARRVAVGLRFAWLDGELPVQAVQDPRWRAGGVGAGPGTGQHLLGGQRAGQRHQLLGAGAVAARDPGADHKQVGVAAPGDVPGFALAALLHRARLDPWAVGDPGGAVAGRAVGVKPPGLLHHLDHPRRGQQPGGVGHRMEEKPPGAGADQAGLLPLVPQPLGALG